MCESREVVAMLWSGSWSSEDRTTELVASGALE
jgi:hypothetical protein